MLSTDRVRLQPLTAARADPLAELLADPDLWIFTVTKVVSVDEARAYLGSCLASDARGDSHSFVIEDIATGRLAGTTRLMNVSRQHRKVEGGGTRILKDFQRTHVNTHAKYLLLCFAFEHLKCIRVEFQTDSINAKSRASLARLGATEEGTLRNNFVRMDGRIRSSVWFSVIEPDWPEVKKRFETELL